MNKHSLLQPKAYLSLPPGFEFNGRLELYDWWSKAQNFFQQDLPEPEIEEFNGGLEFSAPLPWLEYLAHGLKIPARMLLRLGQGSCRNKSELENLIKKLPLKEFSLENFNFDIHSTSRSSKMNHKREIEQTVKRALKHLEGAPRRRMDIRFFRDECTVSVDVVGDFLYKRGFKENISEAPLRENIASHLLRLLWQGIAPERRRQMTLVDPMSGSGTFTQEAILMPQLLHREETYLTPLPFSAMKREGEVLAMEKFWVNERDPKVFRALQKNLEGTPGVEQAKVEVHNFDLFKMNKSHSLGPALVAINPPFGDRVKKEKRDFEYLEDLIAKIEETFSPERIGVLFPQHAFRFHEKSNHKILQTFEFDLGGKPVRWTVLSRM